MPFPRAIARRLVRFLSRTFRVRPIALAGALAASMPMASMVIGCVSPMTPAAKLNDAVQEQNSAARFGRNDAMEHVAMDARTAYLKRHALWGGTVRIVDVELGSLEKFSQEEAIVLVGYSWFRPSEGDLRTTMIRQTWKNEKGSGPWKLVDEQRASGDVGLLGEPPVVVMKPSHVDRHFETKVIAGQ